MGHRLLYSVFDRIVFLAGYKHMSIQTHAYIVHTHIRTHTHTLDSKFLV